MSGKGNCYDNAAVETFFKIFKAKLSWRRSWHTRRQAEMAIFEYINGFYNPRRRHSALGWKSPVAFNGKGPKRALGAAQKRDRSNLAPFLDKGFQTRGALQDFCCTHECSRATALLMDGAFSAMLTHRDPEYAEAAGRAAHHLVTNSVRTRPSGH